MNCYRCATPIPEKARYCFACGADVSGDTAQGMHPLQRDPELEVKLAEEVEGEFVVERLLGRGGMAVVFLARDLQLDRKVAIKVLPPELTYGQGLIERFKREARTAATLDHPHIVPIYRIAKSGKLFWFAMKYIVGESLADVLEREKTLPPDRSAAILTQVADALEFAHQHSIIHRDVKPANVMMDSRGWVTVTDFGIAKAVGLQSLTSSEAMVGTPYYMSPEQCAGKKTLTGASDQYSLGVMAYQMLSGQLPFTGFATVDIIKQHCFDPPPPLDVLRPGLPQGLIKVVERGLAKGPEDRFASVTEFAAAFSAATGAGATASPIVRKPAPPPPRAAAPPRRARRRILLGTLGGLTTIGLVGALVWVWKGTAVGVAHPPAFSSAQVDSAAATPTPGSDSAAAQRLDAQPAVALTPPPAAAAPVETTRTLKPAPQPARVTPRDARLFLRGVSEGATVTLDGRQVRDSVLLLRPGRHEVAVTKPGFAPWADTLWADAGDQLARWAVSLPVVPARVAVPESAPRAQVPPPESVLRIQVQPPARISIDKVDFGEQRTLVHTVAGGASHLISIVPVRAGYTRKDTTITPRPGDTVTVRIRLEGSP
jgi:serine/threonine-protein kinase